MALYLLRQQPKDISPSLFHADDADMDIVFVEQAVPQFPSSVKGVVVVAEGMAKGSSYPTMSYDDLVEKIFSSEHVIVI